jgi:hypothetical protein
VNGYAEMSTHWHGDGDAAHRDVGPPTWPFVLAVPAVLASTVLAVLARRSAHLVPYSLAGWAAGAVVPVLLLVLHRMLDRRRRRQAAYTARAFADGRMTTVAVLGALAGGFNSWAAATWWAS